MLQPEFFYHIYNCANGNENLFREDKYYTFFLRKWSKYIEPIADTYAYCLMPNHFHFLIRCKTQSDVEESFGKFETFQKLSYRYSKQFANLFSSYAQAYNKNYQRRGSLFNPNFKAKEVDSNKYLANVIHYILHNPIHHGFTNKIEDWPHSSYHGIISCKPTKLRRKEIIDWYGSPQEFINANRNPFSFLEKYEYKFTF